MASLETDLTALLKRHGRKDAFVLAQFLAECLHLFERSHAAQSELDQSVKTQEAKA